MSQRYEVNIYDKKKKNVEYYQLLGNNDCEELLQDFARKYTTVDDAEEFEFTLTKESLNELYYTVDKFSIEKQNKYPLILDVDKIAKEYRLKWEELSLGERLMPIINGGYYVLQSAQFLKWLVQSHYISGIAPGWFNIKNGYTVKFGRR